MEDVDKIEFHRHFSELDRYMQGDSSANASEVFWDDCTMIIIEDERMEFSRPSVRMKQEMLQLAKTLESYSDFTFISEGVQFFGTRIGNLIRLKPYSPPPRASSIALTRDTLVPALDLFQFLLSPKTRERLFEPSYQDILADFLLAGQEKFQSKWAKRWLWLCFRIRAIGLVFRCLRTVWVAGLAGIALSYVPPAIRLLWAQFFR